MKTAIEVLEKELYNYEQAFGTWKDSSKIEYSSKWDRINKEMKEIKAAILVLKNGQTKLF